MCGGRLSSAARCAAVLSPVRKAGPDRRQLGLCGGAQGQDLGQRLLQVAVHVIRQRPQGRDVNDADGVVQRAGQRALQQPVDCGQKRGQRLAASGGCRDQGVLSRDNGRPAGRLRRSRSCETSTEPFLYHGMERVQRLPRQLADDQ